MKFKTFGDNRKPAVILLHGGGLSWWSFKKIIENLQSDYYIITPVIDGHGEDGSETFISIEDSAKKLIDFIDANFSGKVYAIGGLSIGAQIVTEVLSRKEDIAQYAVIESALVYPIKGATALTIPAYKLCYGLIKKKWFSKIQARSLFVPDNLFEKYYGDSLNISRQSLINIALSNGNYKLKSTIKNTKSKVLIIAGEKELKIMKKSAKTLHETIPGSVLQIIENMGHGEISLMHPAEYVKLLRYFFANSTIHL